MSDIPGDLKFLSSHEWARVESDGTITIGISDHAQDLLGDIVFVELPEVGQSVDAENDTAIVESVKAASDIYSPLSGEVIEVNSLLEDQPEIINSSLPWDSQRPLNTPLHDTITHATHLPPNSPCDNRRLLLVRKKSMSISAV